MPRYWPVALGAAIVILLVSSPVLAVTEEGRVRLEDGGSLAIAIDNTAGEDLWIEYEVRVLEGPDINVWFTDGEGHMAFHDANATSFSYYPSNSVEVTTYAEDSWSWDEEGLFYVIIDNGLYGAHGQNVTVEYTVTWETYSLDTLFLLSTLVILIIVIIVVMIVVALLVAKREAAVREAKRASSSTEERPFTATPERPVAAAEERTVAATPEGRPEPPEPYPEWMVRASMDGKLDDDDASGWDPGRDEPND